MGEGIEAANIESRGTLSTEGVKNEVEWVNQNLKSSFRFEVGKSTDLGVFITDIDNPESWQLKPEQGHGRTAQIGKVIFEDSRGQLYRDIDIKGMGDMEYLGARKGITPLPRRNIAMGELPGLLNFSSAFHDATMAESLTSLGVRTHRAVAIILLEEIVVPGTGEKVSIEKARHMDLIHKSESFMPVIEVRAFGTRVRLQDIQAPPSLQKEKENRERIEDAKNLIRQEFFPGQELSDLEYLKWLAKTIAKNIGIMHKHGYTHNYLAAGHNITLDGRIVDLDSVRLMEEKRRISTLRFQDFAIEFMQARTALQEFCNQLIFENSSGALGEVLILSQFEKSYAEACPDDWEQIEADVIASDLYRARQKEDWDKKHPK